MVIKKIINIILVFFLFLSFHGFSVYAESRVEQNVSLNENSSNQVERNFFEELHYRIVLKDEPKDFFDYVIFATFVVGLLIVMVFQNTHYIIITKPLEEVEILKDENNYSIEEVAEIKESIEEPKEDEKEEVKVESNPEILSSDFLEEEEVIPKKKKNRNSKKKRA